MKEELKVKVETYYAIQKIRIQAQLRIKAFERDGRMSADEASAQHFWVDETVGKIEEQIKKEVKVLIQDVPIWYDWLEKIRGVGPCLGGSLIAKIWDITRFPTVSKLWAYSLAKCENGRVVRRRRGTKIDWNPFLKTTMYKLTDSFIKQSPEKSFYRHRYDVSKAAYQAKFPQEVEQNGQKLYTPRHIHMMAKRKVAKLFLQHLMVVWYGLEGLEIPGAKPWILTHGGHNTYISPEEVLQYEDK